MSRKKERLQKLQDVEITTYFNVMPYFCNYYTKLDLTFRVDSAQHSSGRSGKKALTGIVFTGQGLPLNNSRGAPDHFIEVEIDLSRLRKSFLVHAGSLLPISAIPRRPEPNNHMAPGNVVVTTS